MRAILCVLDSLGIGATDTAADYGDVGANTLGHIAMACDQGSADKAGLRAGRLAIPNLAALGLGLAAEAAAGHALPIERPETVRGRYGFAAEISRGKDTPSGHWEMLGLPVEFDWGYFPETEPCFPAPLIAALVAEADLPGILGDRHASGTTIIEELGEEHIRSGKPIVYTSGDSVFQIAAHEQHFGLERLYAVCDIARRLVDPYQVGRVIARPFVGERAGAFVRTKNRRDLVTPPPSPTLLDVAKAAGREVVAIGKIGDIFAYQGVTQAVKAGANPSVLDAVLKSLDTAPEGALIVANFNDFDTLFGHRRDVAGYAAALEEFDARLPLMQSRLRPDDLLVLSADHGCDPTRPGSDHTREYVPVIAVGAAAAPGPIGRRETFADIGQSLAWHLRLAPLGRGVSFLE